MKISEKIQINRKAKGLSQEDFANLLNISRQSVQKWEAGTSNPDISKLKQISVILDVSLDYLLDENETNTKPDKKISVEKSEQTQQKISNYSINYKTISIVFIILQYISILFMGIFFEGNIGIGIGFLLGTILITYPFFHIVLNKHKKWAVVVGIILSILSLAGAIIEPAIKSTSSTSNLLIGALVLGILGSICYIISIVFAYKTPSECASLPSAKKEKIIKAKKPKEPKKPLSPSAKKKIIIFGSIFGVLILCGGITGAVLGSIYNSTYTVNFYNGDGNVLTSKTVKYNDFVNSSDSPAPTKADPTPYTEYVFSEWDHSFPLQIKSKTDIYPKFTLRDIPEGTRGGECNLYGDHYCFSYSGSSAETLKIPQTYKGKPVKTLGQICSNNLVSVELPTNIVGCEEGYVNFQSCPKLTSIKITSPNFKFGNDDYINTFCWIDTCPNVEKIEITSQNTNYKMIENKIYSSDGKRLLFHPQTPSSSLTIGNCESIADEALTHCKKITSLTIADGVIEAGIDLQNFSNLKNINFGKDVMTLPWIFPKYSTLNISFSESSAYYKTLNNDVYSKDGSSLCIVQHASGSYTVPDGVKFLGGTYSQEGILQREGRCAFLECRNISHIYLPASLEYISGYQFQYCESLTSLHFSGTKAQWNNIKSTFAWDRVPNIKYVQCKDGNVNI